MNGMNRPHTAVSNPPRQKLIQKLEAAALENQEFARAGTQMIVLLTNYQADMPIPDRFWRLYQQLAKTVSEDGTGKLLFTETQMEVVYIIRDLMRDRGLLVELPDEPDLQAALDSAAAEFEGCGPLLEETFYPAVLDNANEEMDIWFFLSLLSKAAVAALATLDRRGPADSEHEGSRAELQAFQKKLIDCLVRNPHLAGYARQQSELLAQTYESGASVPT